MRAGVNAVVGFSDAVQRQQVGDPERERAFRGHGGQVGCALPVGALRKVVAAQEVDREIAKEHGQNGNSGRARRVAYAAMTALGAATAVRTELLRRLGGTTTLTGNAVERDHVMAHRHEARASSRRRIAICHPTTGTRSSRRFDQIVSNVAVRAWHVPAGELRSATPPTVVPCDVRRPLAGPKRMSTPRSL